jgi:methylphosphotriester-DNA--protein-cysteine methyltransferase
MYRNKKEKLLLSDLIDDPPISYPAYYQVSHAMMHNERLHDAIRAVHGLAFEQYANPSNHHKLFEVLHSGGFAIFKERYVVGYFGERMMYLEAQGWRALPASEAIFGLEHWMI